MTRCQLCDATLGSKAKFCSGCGNPVPNSSASNHATPKINSTIKSDLHGISAANGINSKRSFSSNGKIFKPNAASINSIRHTLFVLPEYFSESFKEILHVFEVEAAGVVLSINGSCVIDRCQQLIRDDRAGSIQYVCIIGNWHDVPPVMVPNDFGLDDGDAFCQSDAFFGAILPFNPEDPFTAIPDIPVGRIPVADQSVVQRVLGSDPEVSSTRNSFQFGVTAQCWEVASRKIVSSFPNLASGGPNELLPQEAKSLPKSVLISSPQWTEQEFRRVAYAGPSDAFGLMYFNVHGGADEPQWVGEGEYGGYVRIFEPGTVVDFNSALLVSEACYGGALSYDSPSIVENFFTCGGQSFVGSSTIAYGAKATPITAADLIAKHYILGLYDGLTKGEALKLAKMEVLVDDPLSLEYSFKTVLSFNLFGAPWQTLVRSSVSATLTRPSNERPLESSVLNRVRSNMQSPLTSSGSTINRIREEYRSRLPARSRQFLVQSSEILTKLREFKDFSRIMEEVSKWGASTDDLKLDFVSAGNFQGYRLICTANETKKSKSTLILITDKNGQLTKTLESKGAK